MGAKGGGRGPLLTGVFDTNVRTRAPPPPHVSTETNPLSPWQQSAKLLTLLRYACVVAGIHFEGYKLHRQG